MSSLFFYKIVKCSVRGKNLSMNCKNKYGKENYLEINKYGKENYF